MTPPAPAASALLAWQDDLGASTPPPAMPPTASYDGLVRALGSVLCVVALGFAVRSRGAAGSEALERGLGTYVASAALPVTLFRALATQIDLSDIGWHLLGAVALGKAAVFALALAAAMLFGSSRDVSADPAGQGVGVGVGRLGDALAAAERLKKAGMWAIAATQSNDLPIGLPLVAALLPDMGYTKYLYLIAIPQMLILNPIGYAMMDRGVSKEHAAMESLEGVPHAEPLLDGGGATRGAGFSGVFSPAMRKRVIGSLFVRTLLNPLVLGALLGVAYNVVFGMTLPPFFDSLCSMIAVSFAPTSLFLLGASMYGKSGRVRGKSMLLPGFLIVLKLIVLPIVSRLVADIMPGLTEHCKSFVLLYGSIPVAPSVYVYARQYGVQMDQIAIYVIMCLLASAPLMLLSSLLMADTAVDLGPAVANYRVWCHALSSVACMALLAIACCARKWRRRSYGVHEVVTACASFQLVFNLSFLLCLYAHGNGARKADIYALENTARIVARLGCAAFGPVLYMLSGPQRRRFSLGYGGFALILLPALAMTLPLRFWGKKEDPSVGSNIAEPCFIEYGNPQLILTLAYDLVLLIFAAGYLVVSERRYWRVRKRRLSVSSYQDLTALAASEGDFQGSVGFSRAAETDLSASVLSLAESDTSHGGFDFGGDGVGVHASPFVSPLRVNVATGRSESAGATLSAVPHDDPDFAIWEARVFEADDSGRLSTRVRVQIWLLLLVLDVLIELTLDVSKYSGINVSDAKLGLVLLLAMSLTDARGISALLLFGLQPDALEGVKSAARWMARRAAHVFGVPVSPGSTPPRSPPRQAAPAALA